MLHIWKLRFNMEVNRTYVTMATRTEADVLLFLHSLNVTLSTAEREYGVIRPV